jgi:hypothetical protein
MRLQVAVAIASSLCWDAWGADSSAPLVVVLTGLVRAEPMFDAAVSHDSTLALSNSPSSSSFPAPCMLRARSMDCPNIFKDIAPGTHRLVAGEKRPIPVGVVAYGVDVELSLSGLHRILDSYVPRAVVGIWAAGEPMEPVEDGDHTGGVAVTMLALASRFTTTCFLAGAFMVRHPDTGLSAETVRGVE